MNYVLKPTFLFLEQVDELSYRARQLLKKKLELLKINPTRNKRILGYNLFLFRIRFSDSKREKRVVYLLDKKEIKILCILNRDKGYKDLKIYLRRLDLL